MNEKDGISDFAFKNCYALVKIPMYGFVESYNVSVAAAILLTQLFERIKKECCLDWPLNKRQKNQLLKKWIWNNTRVGQIIQKKRMQKRMP